MELNEFKKYFLKNYLLLEEDFISTFIYVTPEKENFKTYSNVYQKQILAIGSEVDVLKNLICKMYKSDFNEKDENKNKIIIDNFPDILKLELIFDFNIKLTLKPWNSNKEPDWWTVYNEIKHNRICNADSKGKQFDENKKWYQYANLENTINALAALHTLELIAYKKVAEDNSTKKNEVKTIPSFKTIFQISNSHRKDKTYNMPFSIDDGSLMIDASYYSI